MWRAMASLERELSAGFVARLKDRIQSGGAHRGATCPTCACATVRVSVAIERSGRGQSVEVDACGACDVVRIDPDAFDQLPLKAPEVDANSPAFRRALAVDAIASENERQRALRRWSDDVSDVSTLGRVLMWIGVPVEVDAPELTRKPLLTWILGGALVATHLVLPTFGSEAWRTLAWIPSDPWRLGGLSIVTCFFVHASWLHLLGNLYFLLVFGRAVENRIGAARMAALLLVATMVGSFVHAALDPRHGVPCVGASGGLSALILCYAAVHPWNRFGIGMWILLRPRLVVAPAVLWAGLWFLWQIVGALRQSVGLSSISSFAHLGGALTGIVAAWFWRKNRKS
jgi:membrane associated rhomboid family serine protease